MNLKQWLSVATKQLNDAGISSARLDCLLLAGDELSHAQAWLLAHPEAELSKTQLVRLEKNIKRRAKHEPLAYIRGFTEFYGRKFLVNKAVLEPRPESETMIELLLKLDLPKSATIADIGTGSGALAITANLELPSAEVWATDIDPKCIKVALQNAKLHNVKVDFYEGDLLQSFSAKSFKLSAILANLPYVPDSWQINQAAAMEPKLAIFGGKDGLALYRQLFGQIDKLNQKPKYILTESLPPQHGKLARIASGSGYHQISEEDFIQVFSR